jgi:hypothetical protein
MRIQRKINWAGAMRDMRNERHPQNRLASDLLAALKDLLAQVDARCGGRAEGNSELVRAADQARAVITKVEGH